MGAQYAIPDGYWRSYTPTPGGAGFTVGNGTATGRYARIGNTVHFWAKFVFGSTSSVTSANPSLSLPVTAAASETGSFGAVFTDSGVQNYAGFGLINAGGTAILVFRFSATNQGGAALTSTTPFTWGTADFFHVNGTYELA